MLKFSQIKKKKAISYRGIIKKKTKKPLVGAGFPAGLVVRIWCFHYGGPGSIPGWGTKILLSCPVQQKKKKLHYSTLRYIIVKLLKTKLKEKYLKAAREKLLLSTGIQRHKGLLIRNN